MKTKLSFKETLLVASTLFGMFFGAGNLIFPVHMGQLAGSNVLPAVIGFIITGVSIPVLGVAAIGMTHSTGLLTFSGKVGRKYSYIFTCALYLTIGPCFAIPRCATTSFTTGIAPMLSEGASERLPLFLFSAAFFAAVLFFSLRPSGIMTWIGKIINPIFLVSLFTLLLVALLKPAGSIPSITPDPSYQSNAIFNGIIEGYGTMDGLASLAFGVIVIDVIKSLGIKDSDHVAGAALKSGIFAGVLMSVLYLLITIMGTQSRGIFETSANGGIALVQIANHYFGSLGGIILAIIVTFACLKTAIGLVTSCSETFNGMFPGKLSYRTWCIVFTLFSFIIANAGLTAIINYAVPVLMLLYPPATVLIFLGLFDKAFGGARSVYVCAIAGSLVGAVFDFLKTLPFGLDVSFAAKFLPFFNLGLGWIVPTLIGLVIGFVLKGKTKTA